MTSWCRAARLRVVLRAAAISPANETAAHDRGIRPVHSDCTLFPGRSPTRRPPARVHAARSRDGLRHRRRHHVDDRSALYRADARSTARKRIPETPFPRITYAESMRRFGNDRPDIRFGVELQDVSAALTRARRFRHLPTCWRPEERSKASLFPVRRDIPAAKSTS